MPSATVIPTPPDPAPAAEKPYQGGPRTKAGKDRAKMNATRHGLRGEEFQLLPHEDPAAFDAFAQGYRRRFQPQCPHEAGLVEAMIVAGWRQRRGDVLEAEVLSDIPPAAANRTCGTDLVAKPQHNCAIGTVLRYQSHAQLQGRRAFRE
ncbi:MAG TPA: hypothetical protein VFG43_00655, partial [Geminicoccaceae bacterium]|nr:hypothetical protein [Geminicoccaceae bacterium]